MNNPWQGLFNNWLDALGTEKNEMKKYEVKLETTATVSVFVDATNEDEAIEIAYDLLDEKDAVMGEWEVLEVDPDYD
jgi:hypothetical protein